MPEKWKFTRSLESHGFLNIMQLSNFSRIIFVKSFTKVNSR